ncbi:unnamed protein product [Prorocentrum cordatum]|uniref:Potassium channel domain-containing protein n=1 Tax=Prorocentrum cordatum TaxID=2364126 RepID=A0ABN9Y541_9DINO|nr:unnamed protein product [Polarella glacialis]
MSLSFMDRISEPDETTPLRSTPDASWQERQRFPSEFVGLWVCKDGSFYDGSTIEIGSNHWCPLRPTGIVKSSAVYSWRVVDGRCQLVDTRGAGESYVYNLSSCHDGTLEVITQSESWYLVRARHRRTSKTVSPAQPEMLGQIVHTKGRQVCLLFSTVSILVCVFLIGTFEEDWSVITAIYVLTQCLLTIGFGDVAVTHDITKMSLSLLMLSSLVTIAFIAKQIVDVVVQKKTLRATTKATELQMKIVKGLQASAHAGPSKSTDPTADDRGDSDVRQILVGVAPFVCSLAFGTIFYATYAGGARATDTVQKHNLLFRRAQRIFWIGVGPFSVARRAPRLARSARPRPAPMHEICADLWEFLLWGVFR